MSQRRALIVDDEPTVASALSLAAGDAAWEVETAHSAEEALRLLTTRKFDAILVDKNLPGMTGVELIRRARELHRAAAIVMMTGYASPESASETLNLGVDAYIEKPFDDIFAIIQRINRI